MRYVGGHILFSATDLMRFMGCAHATTLDLACLRGEGPEPREDSEDAVLLQKQGDAHEVAHLARLGAAGRGIVEIARGYLAQNAAATRAALAAGPEVLFQGAFLSGNWGGWSDFLERVERSSDLGAFSYEVADTKLKRHPHPKHVLQLVLYSDLLTEIQGVAPEFAHVELGDGTRATLRLADYSAYARMARARLEGFVANPTPTRPIPCADCGLCRWADHCESVWQTADSLFNVANISRGQVKKLEAVGIATMEALANLGQGGLHPDLTVEDVEGPPPETPEQRPAPQRALQDANALHPDFDFDPNFSELPIDNKYLQSVPPATIQQTGDQSVLVPFGEPEEHTHDLDSAHADEDNDSTFEPASDPLDLAISLDDLAVEEDDAPLEADWDDYSIEDLNNVTVQEIEPLDIFDFDFSDLEAEFEAERMFPETPSARDQRLDGVAADLVLGLGAFPSSERRALHRRFRAILEDFPHHSSHLALHRLLAAGASLEEIEEAANLWRLWLDQPWLWGQKRRALRAWEVWRNPGQRLAFGWPTALRLVRVFGIVEAEQALGEDWLQTWIDLQRHQASNLAEEMAFFTYSEFLRQVSRPFLLSFSEGVHDEPTEREGRMEIRDGHGLPIWRLEPKLPQRVGELSLDPARIRNHRNFDEAAHESKSGLGGLQAANEIENVAAGYRRAYLFPEQDCGLTRNATVKLSAETGHGNAEIVALDTPRLCIIVEVPHNFKRLLANRIALALRAPAAKPANAKPETRRAKAKEGKE